jgi:hypothetical protein
VATLRQYIAATHAVGQLIAEAEKRLPGFVQGMIAQAPQDQVTDFIGKVAHAAVDAAERAA